MQLPVPSITPTTTTEAEFVRHYFVMYESLGCEAQGQNQQPRVDLCSSGFPATNIHQGGTLTPSMQAKADAVRTVVG